MITLPFTTGTTKVAVERAPTEAEKLYAHVRQEDGGIKMHGPLVSAAPSSTRSELMAILVGLLGPEPVHIASDSSAAVQQVQHLLAVVVEEVAQLHYLRVDL